MGMEGALFDNSGNRKYLNNIERQRFHAAALEIVDPVRRTFVMTLFYTGARISEVLDLSGTNLDMEEKVLVLRTLKQRGQMRLRVVPIPLELCRWLQESTNLDQKIWEFCRTTAWKTVKDCMQVAGIDGIRATPKGLRHGFAVACIQNGIPISTLRKWMGHARLESTTVYLDLVGDEERSLASRLWNVEEIDTPLASLLSDEA